MDHLLFNRPVPGEEKRRRYMCGSPTASRGGGEGKEKCPVPGVVSGGFAFTFSVAATKKRERRRSQLTFFLFYCLREGEIGSRNQWAAAEMTLYFAPGFRV